VPDYHKSKGTSRCAMKIDLMKAYDSVSWDFILHCMVSLVPQRSMFLGLKLVSLAPLFQWLLMVL
jgi:hypothetical protein